MRLQYEVISRENRKDNFCRIKTPSGSSVEKGAITIAIQFKMIRLITNIHKRITPGHPAREISRSIGVSSILAKLVCLL